MWGTKLTVWGFQAPDEGDAILAKLMVGLDTSSGGVGWDAASLTWDGSVPRMRRADREERAAGGLDEGFWYLLLSTILQKPLLDAACEQLPCAHDVLTKLGVEEEFITAVRGGTMHGRSALFLLAPGSVADWVGDTLLRKQAEEIASIRFTAEQYAGLRWSFSPISR